MRPHEVKKFLCSQGNCQLNKETGTGKKSLSVMFDRELTCQIYKRTQKKKKRNQTKTKHQEKQPDQKRE